MQGVTITLEELLSLRYVANWLNLSPRRATQYSKAGGYLSSFRGRGMDFVETRIYQPGDDIRTINWAVTARTGRPHTKVYQQERERPVYIIIDFKPSMYFGTRKAFKSVVAAHTAALIAWSALKNGDRVGGLLLKGEIYYLLPPSQHKRNVTEFLKQLVIFVNSTCETIENGEQAFQRLRKIIKSGSLIYFLSDFYVFNESLQNELRQLAKQHEIINVLIYDKLEKEFPPNGRYLFHDSLKDNLLIDTSDHALCKEYSNYFHQRLQRVKKFCFATGMQFAEISTSENTAPQLVQRPRPADFESLL
jgi:uncharacterized protein (DUF58 family)